MWRSPLSPRSPRAWRGSSLTWDAHRPNHRASHHERPPVNARRSLVESQLRCGQRGLAIVCLGCHKSPLSRDGTSRLPLDEQETYPVGWFGVTREMAVTKGFAACVAGPSRMAGGMAPEDRSSSALPRLRTSLSDYRSIGSRRADEPPRPCASGIRASARFPAGDTGLRPSGRGDDAPFRAGDDDLRAASPRHRPQAPRDLEIRRAVESDLAAGQLHEIVPVRRAIDHPQLPAASRIPSSCRCRLPTARSRRWS